VSYFDDLEIDVKQEKPAIAGDVEAARRLLYLLKASLNGSAMALADKNADDVCVAVSPEWLDLLGWTAEDLNDDPDQMWHPDDLEMISEIGSNDLAGPYSARMIAKGGSSYGWARIEGLSFVMDDHLFRCWIVEEV